MTTVCWRAEDLPYKIGQKVTCKFSHSRGPKADAMLSVEVGEVGRIVELHEGDPDPDGIEAWAVVEWPSGLRDAWSHPDAYKNDDD